MVAVRSFSSPAAPRTIEPVQTDVVNRVPAWALAHPLEDPLVVLEGARPDAAGEDDHVGPGHLLEGGVAGQAEHAVLAADLAALVADER